MSHELSTAAVVGGCWYELLARVRPGSLGTVHVACKRGALSSPPVAVKRVHAHLVADKRVRRAVQTEATIGAWLRHPNAVEVHELSDLGVELLLVMEYIEGAALSELLQIWPVLPPSVAVAIVLDAAAGLGALHGLRDEAGHRVNAVHRDVSPSNLIVGRDGCTRLTGFASTICASLAEPPADLRLPIGRCAHCAPEHIVGYACDARSDVFSLAVVAWELLAARPLFRASTDGATMQRIISMRAPKLSTIVPELGDALDEVLVKALCKNPEDRFESVERFAAELCDAAAWSTGIASRTDVGSTVEDLVGDALACRRADIEEQLPSSGVYARLRDTR
jgi:serine/threonine-protein kinase